jgi:hypothetical protein
MINLYNIHIYLSLYWDFIFMMMYIAIKYRQYKLYMSIDSYEHFSYNIYLYYITSCII